MTRIETRLSRLGKMADLAEAEHLSRKCLHRHLRRRVEQLNLFGTVFLDHPTSEDVTEVRTEDQLVDLFDAGWR